MKKIRPDLELIANLIPEKAKVLDIGCSDGELLSHIRKQKHADARGIELSQQGVSTCVKKGLSVIQGDADTDLIHYPTHSFDYVISSQMIQATRHPKEVLKELLRIGKHAIISIPNFGYWRNRLHLLTIGRMPVTKTLSYEWYETPNIHFCTTKDFEALLKELGAKIEKRRYLDGNGKALDLLKSSVSSNLFSEKAIFLVKK